MSSSHPQPLLLAYDGSEPAGLAIERASVLWPGAAAVVLTVWASAENMASAGLLGVSSRVVTQAIAQLDEAAARAAATSAEQGARLAAEHGLQATPATAKAAGNVWATLDREAAERDALAVVVGSRGRSEVHAFLLGSVTQGLVHHCQRPVVVVRSAGDRE